MKYIPRKLEEEVMEYLDVKEYMAIIGPRQAGKTTLLERIERELIEQKGEDRVILVTFQDQLEVKKFEEDPVAYIHQQRKIKDGRTYILIDEFQYAQDAGRSLKLIYDTVPDLKLIITGSSSLEIRQITSQMVGRIFIFYLSQLRTGEMLSDLSTPAYNYWRESRQKVVSWLSDEKTDLSLPSSVGERDLKRQFHLMTTYGAYPAVWTSSTSKIKKKRLADLYNTYVEKDIMRFLKIGNLDKFNNFVQYMALHVGELYNQSHVQSDLGLGYEEANIFSNALEQTYVLQKVAPYSRNKTNELKKSSLFYFTDIGLRNKIIDIFQEIDKRPDRGHLVENVVLKKLCEIVQDESKFKRVYFWRKKSGAEVDFVLERLGSNPAVIPVEVKYSHLDKPRISKSYRSFLREYEPSVGMIITKDYLGKTKTMNSDILFIPAHIF